MQYKGYSFNYDTEKSDKPFIIVLTLSEIDVLLAGLENLKIETGEFLKEKLESFIPNDKIHIIDYTQPYGSVDE